MERNEAFEIVLDHYSQAEIARMLEISASAISQWQTKGVPPTRAVQIERIMNKKVTKEQLCPNFPWK